REEIRAFSASSNGSCRSVRSASNTRARTPSCSVVFSGSAVEAVKGMPPSLSRHATSTLSRRAGLGSRSKRVGRDTIALPVRIVRLNAEPGPWARAPARWFGWGLEVHVPAVAVAAGWHGFLLLGGVADQGLGREHHR